MFCYTSGTTGDPKAAMLTHKNLTSAASNIFLINGVQILEDDVSISYLPLAHSFEKVLFTAALLIGVSYGFYSGDPLKLLDDLAILKPHFFPSVPRLFNRIYDKILAGIKARGPAAAALFNRAVSGKLRHLGNKATYTHSVWDNIFFNKMRALLGGRVKMMCTGSAPISPEVLSFLKVCFCCPILEGYGQTESAAASCMTSPFDPVAGHVGGPMGSIRLRVKDLPEM